MLSITPNIRINGDDYRATPESSKGGCVGCAFEHDIEQCEQAVQFHSCSAERIIWVKVKPIKYAPNPVEDKAEPIKYAPNPVEDKTSNPNVGRKYDSGKPMYNLLPADALEEVVKVLTYGAVKYNEPIDQENWRLVPNPQNRYFSACQRHLWADKRGEELDPESEHYHLAHAISSLLFKLQLKIEENKTK